MPARVRTQLWFAPPLELSWVFKTDCLQRSNCRELLRVYTVPKEMETTTESFPGNESRLFCMWTCSSLPVYYVIHSDFVWSPVLPNGRTLAGRICWNVVTKFYFRKSYFILTFKAIRLIKDRVSEISMTALGFRFFFHQMESICRRLWQKVEVR